MAREYVDRLILTLRGVDLDDIIVSVDEGLASGTKEVETMNKSREVKGFKRGTKKRTLTLDAEQVDDPTLPDWEDLYESGELFTMKKIPNAGKAVSWIDCVVTDVQNSNRSGDSSRKVTIMYRRRKKG